MYSKQLVRLLECETKARRAVVGTAASKQQAQQASSEREHRPKMQMRADCFGFGFGRTAARESFPGHWRRLSIALQSAHIQHRHTVTLSTARRLVEELPLHHLPSARRLDRAASGRALLPPSI